MAKKNSSEPLIYAVLLCLGVLFGLLWNRIVKHEKLNADTKIEQVMGLVESEYVDSVSASDIEDKAINELLSSFDPHSVYIPAQYVEMASQDLKGGFQGIGIEFSVLNDTPNVVRVIKDGPAAMAKLKPGDRIIKVDTINLIGLKNADIINAIKGNKNTSFVGTIYRKSTKETLSITIDRGTVKTPSVYSGLINDQTIYAKIEHFAEKTHSEFTEQVKKLMASGKVTGMVLDLRGNPGGYLQTAIKLLDEFVDGNDILAYTQSKGGKRKEYRASNGGMCKDLKVVCLVNNRSASASEIVSGALQDLDKAVIIGSQTYGKGLVQETFQLKDGAQIRLTVSRYYIPSGRSIQKPYDDKGYQDLDSLEILELEKPYKTKNGRVVKSSGGITPDIYYTPSDASISYHQLGNYTSQLVDKNINRWSNMTSDDWLKSKEVSAEIEDVLQDSVIYKNPVTNRLVYQLFGIGESYKQSFGVDSMIMKSVYELNNHSLLNP